MKELTRWFAGSVRPVRAGVYETRWSKRAERSSLPQYQHWDGLVWSAWAFSIEWAEDNAGKVSGRQEPEWRGLAEAPK